MITNDIANMHLLKDSEIRFFKYHIDLINSKILEIIEEHQLKGEFTLSSDYKWLVKVKD